MKYKLSLAIMFFLLATRLLDNILIDWGSRSFQEIWFKLYFIGITYILSASLVLLNKDNLKNLHVDKLFIKIFSITGILLFLFYLPIEIGVFVGAIALLILWMFYKGKFAFGASPQLNKRQVILLIVFSLSTMIPASIAVITLLHNGHISLNITNWVSSAYGGLSLVLYEELLFRGMLWSFLKDLNMSDRKVYYTQAVIFWIAHHHYFTSSPFGFWLIIPLTSLVYGLLVWRTESLSRSTIAHFALVFLDTVGTQSL